MLGAMLPVAAAAGTITAADTRAIAAAPRTIGVSLSRLTSQ